MGGPNWTEQRAVFETPQGWAVCQVTGLWRSCYEIAVRRGLGAEVDRGLGAEVETHEGRAGEPLAHLLAEYDGDLLRRWAAAIDADERALADEPDPAVRESDAREVAARRTGWQAVAGRAAAHGSDPDGRPVPVPYAEGRSAWDGAYGDGRPYRVAEMTGSL